MNKYYNYTESSDERSGQASGRIDVRTPGTNKRVELRESAPGQTCLVWDLPDAEYLISIDLMNEGCSYLLEVVFMPALPD